VDASGNYLRGRAASTDLSDVSATPATDGQVLIFDGPSSTYIPGDPRVQGLAADGTTTVLNPVEIGGYDTAGTPAIHRATFINGTPAGTEYGIITRNIPSGTQPVSGTVAVSNFPTTLVLAQNEGFIVRIGVAAQFLSLDRARVIRLARAGKLPAHPLGEGKRKQWRFRLSELDRYMQGGINGTHPPVRQ
jgi:hypothetical protein